MPTRAAVPHPPPRRHARKRPRPWRWAPLAVGEGHASGGRGGGTAAGGRRRVPLGGHLTRPAAAGRVDRAAKAPSKLKRVGHQHGGARQSGRRRSGRDGTAATAGPVVPCCPSPLLPFSAACPYHESRPSAALCAGRRARPPAQKQQPTATNLNVLFLDMCPGRQDYHRRPRRNHCRSV